MSAALHLARLEDLEKILKLNASFHAEMNRSAEEDHQRTALTPLLEGSPYGAAYLIGPARAPIGYIIVTFSWAMASGGLEARIDELFLRPAVRGRGIAAEVMIALPTELARAGIRCLHLEIDPENRGARKLFEKSGFSARDNIALMSRAL